MIIIDYRACRRPRLILYGIIISHGVHLSHYSSVAFQLGFEKVLTITDGYKHELVRIHITEQPTCVFSQYQS